MRIAPAVVMKWDHRRAASAWKAPMNGQPGRQAIVRELLTELDIELVVETGTYTGSTTLWFAEHGVRVVSSELDDRYRRLAAERIRRRADVRDRITVLGADSRAAIGSIGTSSSFTACRTLFYLDAHWNEDLPLRGELALIEELWDDYVIVIDDFRVDDDPGYSYDVYSPEVGLTREYLATWSGAARHRSWWPAVPSSDEPTGSRGCIVLAPPGATADRIEQLSRVRLAT